MNTVDQQLETFRINFPLTRVRVEENYMTYRVRRGLAKSLSQDANELIKRLDLDLVALPTPLSADDSIVIQPQWMQL